MKKRILSLLLALVMIVGMLPTVALAADEAEPAEVADAQTEQVEPAGTKKEPAAPEAKLAEVSEQAANGSETAVYAAPGTTKIDDKDYYQLGSKEDLEWFRNQVNSGTGTINAVLANDIDLRNENWTPIGTTQDWVTTFSENPFKGTFDGGGYTISGLKIEVSAGGVYGLFGATESPAKIQNLVVRGSVAVTIPSSAYMGYVAGVVGQPYNTTLEQVVSYVDVTSTNKSSSASAAGGLCGNGNGATIRNCANYGTIQSTDSNSNANVGGLSAMSPYGGKVTIANSLNAGAVSGAKVAGGLMLLAPRKVRGSICTRWSSPVTSAARAYRIRSCATSRRPPSRVKASCSACGMRSASRVRIATSTADAASCAWTARTAAMTRSATSAAQS